MKKLITVFLLFIFLCSFSSAEKSIIEEEEFSGGNYEQCIANFQAAQDSIFSFINSQISNFGHIDGAIEYFLDLENELLGDAARDFDSCLLSGGAFISAGG